MMDELDSLVTPHRLVTAGLRTFRAMKELNLVLSPILPPLTHPHEIHRGLRTP